MSSRIFGPVASRRLGRSLGVDLLPYKTCTYDCVYCQLGRTTNLTTERREWVDTGEVMEEARRALSQAEGLDYITFSGSGEPTLHSRIGEMIRELKRESRVPVAVLTNGSLLWQDEVQEALLEADLILPSLDAPDKGLFRHVNRPHPDLSFEQVLDGLIRFRERYQGKIWLEILLLSGITGIEREVKRLAEQVRSIRPDLVQLMTVSRPPSLEYVRPVAEKQLRKFVSLFDVPAVVVPAVSPASHDVHRAAGREEILHLLERRPCTIEEIALGLGMAPAEVGKYVDDLYAHGQLKVINGNDGSTYYSVDPD